MVIGSLGVTINSTTSFSSVNQATNVELRYHGRWILTKNGKKLFFAVQIEKTEINILQRKWEKKLFYFSR